MRFIRWIPALLMLLPATGAAQLQTVRGTVRDSLTGAPLAGADVLLGSRLAATNAEGAFRLDSIAPGPHYVTVRFAGYVPIRTRLVVLTARPTVLDYRMDPAPFLLPPVVTELRRVGIFGAVGDTTRKPLAGARVEVAGVNGGSAITDARGGFSFPAADRGTYLVRITHPGYGERQFALELAPGEGRQVVVVLTPSKRRASRAETQALEALSNRLAFGLRWNRLTPSELARYGSQGLCSIPRVAVELGQGDSYTTIILNGVTVLERFPVSSLCGWRADEVALVEFGRDLCDDVTGSIALSLPVPAWCIGPSRGIGGGRAASYAIIWEKR